MRVIAPPHQSERHGCNLHPLLSLHCVTHCCLHILFQSLTTNFQVLSLTVGSMHFLLLSLLWGQYIYHFYWWFELRHLILVLLVVVVLFPLLSSYGLYFGFGIHLLCLRRGCYSSFGGGGIMFLSCLNSTHCGCHSA